MKKKSHRYIVIPVLLSIWAVVFLMEATMLEQQSPRYVPQIGVTRIAEPPAANLNDWFQCTYDPSDLFGNGTAYWDGGRSAKFNPNSWGHAIIDVNAGTPVPQYIWPDQITKGNCRYTTQGIDFSTIQYWGSSQGMDHNS